MKVRPNLMPSYTTYSRGVTQYYPITFKVKNSNLEASVFAPCYNVNALIQADIYRST